MIVNDGLVQLEQQQLTYMAGLKWGLFVSNLTITGSTVLATVTAAEAAWSGYTRQTISGWPVPTVASSVASSSPSTLLTFTNSSGSAVTFWGWFVMDDVANKLVAALNLGSTSIPAGGSYSFSPALTDQNTGP